MSLPLPKGHTWAWLSTRNNQVAWARSMCSRVEGMSSLFEVKAASWALLPTLPNLVSSINTVRIDISIFSSPTKAYGYVSGEMGLDKLPEPHTHLPWPAAWVQKHPSYFIPEQSLIQSVQPWSFGGPSHLISMSGIVCESAKAAKACAKFFSETANFEINEY